MSGEIDMCPVHGPYISIGGGGCTECRQGEVASLQGTIRKMADQLVAKDAEIERLREEKATLHAVLKNVRLSLGDYGVEPTE